MANLKEYAAKLWSLEGSFVNHPKDKGKATNRGITYETYKAYKYFKAQPNPNISHFPTIADLKAIDFTEFCDILKWHSWDVWKADEIKNQSVAELVVDWHFNSGKWGVIIPQRTIGVEADGIVGRQTLSALNGIGELQYNQIKDARKKFYTDIVLNNPTQKVFLKGWFNRINKFKYEIK